MLFVLFFLLSFAILISPYDDEENIVNTPVCNERVRRSTETEFLDTIKGAFKTFTTLLTVSSDIGFETEKVLKTLQELAPITV